MLESLEKLREWLDYKINRFNAQTNAIVLNTGVHPDELYVIADEIEAEIAERYMRLPVDADGVPIHVGDWMDGDRPSGKHVNGHVLYIGDGAFYLGNINFCLRPEYMHHFKPRTVEDVLDDLMNDDAWDKAGEYEEIKREIIAKYAAELRMRDGS